MIRSPLGLRLESPAPGSDGPTIRERLQEATKLGLKGVVLDAIGDLSPDRLSDTGRREVRHLLRSAELSLIALNLPTRRGFDTLDQFEDRLARADRAFALAFELGTRLVLAKVGGIPPESEPVRRQSLMTALGDLARRAEHRGVRLAVETGTDPGKPTAEFLASLGLPTLAASIDPAAFLRNGLDPIQAVVDLGPLVAHAYAADAVTSPRSLVLSNPRNGFPPGVLDWENYLGSLEEINYQGYLTLWPDPSGDVSGQIRRILKRIQEF